jgi:hypothetical protein
MLNLLDLQVAVQACIGIIFSVVLKRPGRVFDQSYLLHRLKMSGPKRLLFLCAFKYCTGANSLHLYPNAPKLFSFQALNVPIFMNESKQIVCVCIV